MLRRLVAAMVLAGLAAAAANAAEVAIPPTPARWATDTSGFLKPQTVASLDARLQAYEARTGHQVLVYVAPTTGATPTEDWTVRAFARWKVGRKGLDDGLVLFVFPADHKVRIEVGYGLEQTVPDAVAARIIRETMTPALRAGRPDAAVVAGVDRILSTIGGEMPGKASPAAASAPEPTSDDGGSSAVGVILGIGLALLIVFLVIFTVSRMPRGPFISSGRSGPGFGGFLLGSVLSGVGGGGGFSGGFVGGGGFSGGGGATGSW